MLTPDVAARKRKIGDRKHVLDAEAMLRDAHAPDENRMLSSGVHPSEARHLVAGGARIPLEQLPALASQRLAELLKSAGIGVEELTVERVHINEVLQNAVDE